MRICNLYATFGVIHTTIDTFTFYIVVFMMTRHYEVITEVLGGPSRLPLSPQSELDLVELVRQGLTRQPCFT